MKKAHSGVLDKALGKLVLRCEDDAPERRGHLARETLLALLLDVGPDELVKVVVVGRRRGEEALLGSGEVGLEGRVAVDSGLERSSALGLRRLVRLGRQISLGFSEMGLKVVEVEGTEL